MPLNINDPSTDRLVRELAAVTGESITEAIVRRCAELPDLDPRTADERQAALARSAWRRFGKGRHPAGLNMGDCFAYALSRVSGEPVLFEGDDFSLTDVASAR
jgi:uncharacterized protein with PIN domain